MNDKLKVGEIYNAFDDGKITFSRLLKWRIIREVDFNKNDLDQQTLELLKEEIKDYWWLYNKDQRYIYYAEAVNDDGSFDKRVGYCWFLKAGNGWFGTGYWASMLDHDGSLYQSLIDND